MCVCVGVGTCCFYIQYKVVSYLHCCFLLEYQGNSNDPEENGFEACSAVFEECY